MLGGQDSVFFVLVSITKGVHAAFKSNFFSFHLGHAHQKVNSNSEDSEVVSRDVRVLPLCITVSGGDVCPEARILALLWLLCPLSREGVGRGHRAWLRSAPGTFPSWRPGLSLTLRKVPQGLGLESWVNEALP